MLGLLENHLISVGNFTEQELKEVMNIAVKRNITAGEYLFKAGDIPRFFYFVNRGLFRYVYIDDDGNEYTKGFQDEGKYVVAYSAMQLNRGSYFYAEALEDSEVVIIDFERWNKLMEKYSGIVRYEMLMVRSAFYKKEFREKELLLDDAEARYKTFLSEYQNLECRLKQYHIASYLGITPVALSRVRKKMGLLT